MKKLQKLLLGLFVFGLCMMFFPCLEQVESHAAGYKTVWVKPSEDTYHYYGSNFYFRMDGSTYFYQVYVSCSFNGNLGNLEATGEYKGTLNTTWKITKVFRYKIKDNLYVGEGFSKDTGETYVYNTVLKNPEYTIHVKSQGFQSGSVYFKFWNDADNKYNSVYVGLVTANGVPYIISTATGVPTNEYQIADINARWQLLEGTIVTPNDIRVDYQRRYYNSTTYGYGEYNNPTSETKYSYYWSTVYDNINPSTATCDNTSPGTRDVSVTYAGKPGTCSMTWYKKDLSSITATYPTNEKKIVEGLSYITSDIVITVTYNNGTKDTIYGNHPDVSLSTTTVQNVGENSIKISYTYTGSNTVTKDCYVTIIGLEKDLTSISTRYVGEPIVEEMPISAGDVEIVMSFNNNTTETYRANAPKQSPHNSNASYAWINNDSGTTVYSTKDGTDNFMTTRWSVNKGSMTFTVYNEYYGTKSVKASNTITVPVLKKTPVSVDATYPEEILVVEGLEFDNANVTIAVTYDNGTVYTIDANGLEKSGYTNGYVLDIYNTYASSTDYDDYIGENDSVGESWDTIVYNVGENRFIVDFTENEATVYDDFYVIGEEKTAVEIEATYYGPDVTMGLAYLPGNVEILVTYDNGTVGTLKGTAKSVTLTNEDGVETTAVPNLGVNRYYAQFQECKDDFEVVGKEAVLTSIYVLLKPKRAFYTEEDAFDPTGMIVMATYSDYTEEMVQNSALDLSDGDSLRAGQEKVIIRYTVGDVLKTTSTEVFVDIGTLTHLTIEQEPNKLEYDPGEDFDPTGMVVIAHYSTGKTRTVGRTEYTLVNGENLQSGQSSVTIRLEEDGFPADVEQIITVRPKMLVDIEILRKPNKTTYFPGQNFSTAGMAVMAVYSDDSKKVVTDSCTVLDGTSLPLGKNTVTITYTELVGDDPITISKTIDIIVADATVNNISAIYMGGKIKSGEAFSPSDVMVTINYTNGEKITVDGNYDGITFSTLIVKTVNNTVTVAYRGHTCVIKIPVLNDENNENQSITEIVSKSTWKEFFTVKKTRAVEDYYYSGEYKIPYIRKGIKTQKPLTMDIQFKLYAIEMGGWTSWYNSGELVSTGNAPATNLKVGLLNAPDITLNATINGKTYNDINSTQEFTNPQTISFTMTGSDDFKLQYKASYNGKSTDWVDEGTMIGIPNMSIEGISFRIVKKK